MKVTRPATSRGLALGILLALVTALAFPGTASAAYYSTPTPVGWAAPAPVHAVEAAGDRLYLGTYDSATKNGSIVALAAATGAKIWSVDTTGGDIHDIAVSADGSRVFAGGDFTAVGGAAREHLVALSPGNGAVIDGWTPRTNREVRDLFVNGSTVYLGGTFERVNGVTQEGVGAVDATTGERTGFTGQVTGGYNLANPAAGGVYSLAGVNGRLLVAGEFTAANGVLRNSLASFNLATGALEGWAPAKVCTDCNRYWDIAVDANNVYVGSSGTEGHFGAFRLSNGSVPWPAVKASGDIQAVSVGSDGLVYIGGHFSRYVGAVGTKRTQLAAVIASSGVVDPYFVPSMVDHYPGVLALAQSAGKLVAGGDFAGARDSSGATVSPYLAAFAARPGAAQPPTTGEPPKPGDPPPPPAGSNPCTTLAGCVLKGAVDVDGDSKLDAVGVARRGADGARRGSVVVRVQTYTGKVSTVSVVTRRWRGDPWQGAANLDSARGKDLMVGSVKSGRTALFRSLTWRSGRLIALDAPGKGAYWKVSSAKSPKAGWLKAKRAPKGTIVKRVATKANKAGTRYRATATTYKWTKRGWAAGATRTRPMSAGAAKRWGGFFVAGLGRW